MKNSKFSKFYWKVGETCKKSIYQFPVKSKFIRFYWKIGETYKKSIYPIETFHGLLYSL